MDRKIAAEKLSHALTAAGGLPKPVTREWLERAYAAGVTPKAELRDRVYYYGICRNARVAMWDEKREVFVYVRSKWGATFNEDIRHPEDDDGYDLFVPVSAVEPTDAERLK